MIEPATGNDASRVHRSGASPESWVAMLFRPGVQGPNVFFPTVSPAMSDEGVLFHRIIDQWAGIGRKTVRINLEPVLSFDVLGGSKDEGGQHKLTMVFWIW